MGTRAMDNGKWTRQITNIYTHRGRRNEGKFFVWVNGLGYRGGVGDRYPLFVEKKIFFRPHGKGAHGTIQKISIQALFLSTFPPPVPFDTEESGTGA